MKETGTVIEIGAEIGKETGIGTGREEIEISIAIGARSKIGAETEIGTKVKIGKERGTRTGIWIAIEDTEETNPKNTTTGIFQEGKRR